MATNVFESLLGLSATLTGVVAVMFAIIVVGAIIALTISHISKMALRAIKNSVYKTTNKEVDNGI